MAYNQTPIQFPDTHTYTRTFFPLIPRVFLGAHSFVRSHVSFQIGFVAINKHRGV